MVLVTIQQSGEIKDISQRGKVELGKQVSKACLTSIKIHTPDGLFRNQMISLH